MIIRLWVRFSTFRSTLVSVSKIPPLEAPPLLMGKRGRLGFNKRSKQLCNTPCLSDTATRSKRILCIENFTYRTYAGFRQMRIKTFKKLTCFFLLFRVKLKPGIDKRPNQPCPHCPLMISSISGSKISKVFWSEMRMLLRKSSQSKWGQKLFGYYFYNRFPF